jgi:transcriptional regulator with XRE-family HTH domain
MAGKGKSRRSSKSKRLRPARLAEKLLLIRHELGLSQGGLVRHLSRENQIGRDYVSKFERNLLEPTLDVLLAYARAISRSKSGEIVEALIDDEKDIPLHFLREVTKDRAIRRK